MPQGFVNYAPQRIDQYSGQRMNVKFITISLAESLHKGQSWHRLLPFLHFAFFSAVAECSCFCSAYLSIYKKKSTTCLFFKKKKQGQFTLSFSPIASAGHSLLPVYRNGGCCLLSTLNALLDCVFKLGFKTAFF